MESQKAGIRISIYNTGEVIIHPIKRFTQVIDTRAFRPTTNRIEHHMYSYLKIKPVEELQAASIHNTYLGEIIGEPFEKFATRITKNLKKEKVIQLDELI